MSETRIALMTDLGVVRVDGPDARKLLQGIITNDMGRLDHQPAIHAALLTPQGKILFDFFVVRSPDGYLLETAKAKSAELAQRLNMYKLRADAKIEDASSDYTVATFWGGAAPAREVATFADPRLAALGHRALVSLNDDWLLGGRDATAASADDYHDHRIRHGVPEGGKDYAFGETFPHEALLDVLNGIAFDKGCYVGQEVVSRMHHRGLARRRIVPVKAARDLPATGTDILAGEIAIGRLGSVSGSCGLAMVRLDRAAEALHKGEPITAGGVAITLAKPKWATFDVPVAKASSKP
ncbi:MAG TPA: folate-binding protein YgfZ [Hyphomicrobiaceae bacterium]|nr:folate-binding protein YgfZ [Hyphomicrobiaceae bacterium]